jgi:coenzyme F420-reducing hydrogenase alpha subunit
MNLGSKLKYVGVEMMRKDADRSSIPEVGLFRGFRVRTHEKEILKLIILGVKDRPNEIRALNMAVFNVMTLMFYYGETKEMIVFKNTEDDQKQALDLIEVVLEQLKEEEAMLANDPEIVDIEKFEEVPEEFFAPKSSDSKSSTATKTYNTSATSTFNGTPEWKKREAEKKKEEERQEKLRWTPFLISRVSEKPALKDLNVIKKKLAALAAGEYERELPDPDPPEEEEEKEEEKKISGA